MTCPPESPIIEHMNDKTDINWRDIEEDDSVFLPENAYRTILVETNVTMDVSVAMFVDKHSHILRTREEKLIRYAFID